jgi:hypothetical protein
MRQNFLDNEHLFHEVHTGDESILLPPMSKINVPVDAAQSVAGKVFLIAAKCGQSSELSAWL